MKTLITASALMLASNVAFAASYEDWQQNPDLGTGVYDKPVTLTEPTPSSGDVTVSLDTFSKKNHHYSTRLKSKEYRSSSNEGFASSLDDLNRENPDHI
jgi:hypothetical protein